MPGSTQNKSVRSRLLTQTDTITERENVEWVFRRRSAGSCFFLIPDAAYTLSFCKLRSGETVKTFSFVNHMNVQDTAAVAVLRTLAVLTVKFWPLLFQAFQFQVLVDDVKHRRPLDFCFPCYLADSSVSSRLIFLS